MNSMNPIFLLFIILSPLVIGLLHRCPSKETLAPSCSCSKDIRLEEVKIICQGIERAFDLHTTLKKFQNYVIDRLIIKKCGPFDLTPGTFNRLTIEKITFEDVKFRVLPVFSFLDGIDYSIEELQFLSCQVTEWVWYKGTHFAFIRNIEFHKTSLPAVMTNNTFSIFPNNIRHLKLKTAGISKLKDNALRKFGILERLELEDNRLTSYERSNFPIPARRLVYLSLTKNPLKSLPNNAFVQMRRLEFVSLASTQLAALHQNTFKPVWEQLEEVYFNNIILNCDCNSTWLLDVSDKRIFRPPMCKGVNGKKDKPMNEVKHLEICSDNL